MIKRIASIMCMLFSVSQNAFSADVVADGGARIETTFVRPDADKAYCRTCCHRLSGNFSVGELCDPVLVEECELDGTGPLYEWSIKPNPKGRVTGRSTSSLSVSLAEADVPTSFDVKVRVTWGYLRDDGTTGTASATATMQFDAIGYSYSVRPRGEIDGRGDGALVDSHPGEATVTVSCCRDESSLDLSLSAKPISETYQNEVGSVSMRWVPIENTLTWIVDSPYWYAKSGNPPDCCHTNTAIYQLKLTVDNCVGHEREANVFLPNSDLESASTPTRIESGKVNEIIREIIHGQEKDFIKATFLLGDYSVLYEAHSAASSQYKAKILEEELYHKNQLEREKGFGFEDAFSIADVAKAMGGSGDEFTFISDSEDAIESAKLYCLQLIDREFSNSLRYYSVNHDYCEWAAKSVVGFREAYKYHCTYEDGGAAPPVAKIPKSNLMTNGLMK